jgi:hypothetical protein
MQTDLSFGQKAVGLNFNPSGDDKVGQAKQKCAELIDLVQSIQQETNEPYLTNTIKGEALRSIMDAQMWLVKYITWKV